MNFSGRGVCVAEYKRAFQQPDPRGHDRWSIQGGDYQWYLPDRLSGKQLRLTRPAADRLAAVTEQVTQLGRRFQERPLPALYATLLRSESIASSRIEGVREDPTAVLLAALDDDAQPEHSAARMINRNIDAVRQAVEALATRQRWSATDIDELHHTLLPAHPVGFRNRLVWISGSSPVRAKYVAPHPEHVTDLVEDLVTYLDSSEDPPLVQAALSHAQLETIHPWTDGNGRAGRALIQAVLARSGLVSGGVLPVSVIFGHRDSGYVSALNAFRYDPSRGEPADAAREAFVSFFLEATSDAVVVASDLMAEVEGIEASWAEKTADVRAHSAQHRLLELLADRPVLTIPYALDQAEYTDSQGARRTYSRAAIGKAFQALAAKRIVERMPTRDGRLLVYRAPEIMDLLVLTERRLGSVDLDTVTSPLSKQSRRRAPDLPPHLRRST